jgi:hypothetical protein
MSKLLWASMAGDLVTIKRVLAEGTARIDDTDQFGDTALLLSAQHGHLDCVKWLLQEGGSKCTEADRFGCTALLWASQRGHLDVVKWLLQDGGSHIAETDRDDCCALLLACAHCRLPTAEWLLTDGGARIQIDEVSRQGKTVWQNLEICRPGANDAELTSLLRVMTLLDDAPTAFQCHLKPQHRITVEQGRQIRAMLPPYLLQQRTSLTNDTPLPAVLQSLVVAYAAPTHEDTWADWLQWLQWL